MNQTFEITNVDEYWMLDTQVSVVGAIMLKTQPITFRHFDTFN